MLLSALERSLAAHGVFRDGDDVVLVACSGGLDSVGLAHATVCVLGGRRVVLGHVDHAVRPGSALDADAVRALAVRLGVEVCVDRLAPGRDDEARLRAARYQALERQRAAAGARFVLTAHTQDDQAETVLMGLLRSARLSSLTGIPESRDQVLRPILTVPRRVVGEYVAAHRLPIQEDSTNLEPRYLRNRVRKELLPLLERRYRPGLRRRLAALAVQAAETVTEGAGAGPDWGPAPRRGNRLDPSPWLDGQQWLKMERRVWRGGDAPDGTSAAAFDVEAVGTPCIRLIRPGDRMRPFGMRGHRKLRDLLRENRISVSDRPIVPIVVDDGDRVLWLPGVARSAWGPISGTTREVWWFSIGRDHELQAQRSRATLDGATRGTT